MNPGEPHIRPAIIPTLDEAATRYRTAAQVVMTLYARRRASATAQVTPDSLNQAIEQFFAISKNLERDASGSAATYKDEVSQLGDYAITLLADLATWAGQLGLVEAKQDMEATTLSIADWVMHHEGELRTLDPVVNAAAERANRTKDPRSLEALCEFFGRALGAASNPIKQDLDKTNPGRPWRVLHINRGIVATRTYNPKLMEQVFDDLVRALPEDASHFFAEGMQQMSALNYPAHVRAVMSRYFDQWTRKTMH